MNGSPILMSWRHVLNSLGEPANLDVFAHPPAPFDEATVSRATWRALSYSDVVWFATPTNHAGTLNTGNNVWAVD